MVKLYVNRDRSNPPPLTQMLIRNPSPTPDSGVKFVHVDEFTDEFGGDPAIRYARWFFFLARLAAVYKGDWHPQISQYELYCKYQGKQYRVTGASRMGDIWLSEDFKRTVGYDHRVNVAECSSWTERP